MCKLYLDTDGTTFLLDSTYSLKLLGNFEVDGTFTFGDASVDQLAITGYMTITTTTTAAGAFTGLNNVITCGLTHTGNVAGTRSYVTTDNTGDSIANMFGLVARASLTHASDVVTGTMTGLLAQIDMGSTANSNAANAWGICVNHIETGTRAKIPVAFMRFTDADFGGSAPTNYLFDCGGTGNEFPTGTGKIFYEHTLWTRVNGTDKYIVLSDAENTIYMSDPSTTGITLNYTDNNTEGISITTATSKTLGTGMSISGAGTTTTGILLDATAMTTGISFTGTYTAGIKFAGGANGNPIHIGVKSNTADAGLILTGATDDTGGIMVFCDDGGDALGDITSPIWSRYLITKTAQSTGCTATGLYAQLKTLTGMTITTGSYTALKAFLQVGGTLVTDNAGSEVAIINAGVSFEGNYTCTSGTMSGIDININDGTKTIGTHSGLIVRKTSSSTAGWTYGINIASGGAANGIYMPSVTTQAMYANVTAVAGSSLTGSALCIYGTGAVGTNDVGIAAYFDATANGQSTGNWTYGAGAWLNIGTTFINSAGGWAGHEQLAPLSTGVYIPATGPTVSDADVIYGIKAELVGDPTAPTSNGCYFAALNVSQTAATKTAIFFAHQGGAVGLTTAKSVAGGAVALCNVNGTMYYVNVYTS